MTTQSYQGIKRQNNKFEKLISSKLFWLLFCSFFFAYPIIRSINRELPAELEKYGAVPAFSLIDENEAVYGSKELDGQVYMANFHFSTCPTICVDLMEKMKVIQKRIRGIDKRLIKIVSFTVDPETDTPKKLFRHARRIGASPFVWKFLTGSKKDLTNLLVGGFKVPMGEQERTGELYDIAHSGKIVLVDHNGEIRGYYSTDKNSVNKLMIDIGLLINREQINYKKES